MLVLARLNSSTVFLVEEPILVIFTKIGGLFKNRVFGMVVLVMLVGEGEEGRLKTAYLGMVLWVMLPPKQH